LYWFLTLVTWINIAISFRIIQVADISANLENCCYKMVISLLIATALTQFDDVYAGSYVEFLVRPTDLGMDLLNDQGFDIDQADGSVSGINSKCSFY
jgi:hypothetical protein